MVMCEIPLKLPSLNDYILACRTNRYAGAEMKRREEAKIGMFVSSLPVFDGPVEIEFRWMEKNRRRDLDNVAFAKKFILDALVKTGRLADDGRRFVKGFKDSFEIGSEYKVTLVIKEAAEC